MQLTEAKFLSILILGVGTILVGLLPLCFANRGRQRWPLFLSSLLCFGGGVLLSVSVVHILPEVQTGLPQYKDFAEIIFLGGFFLLYLIDEVVHCLSRGHEQTHLHLHSHGASSGNTIRRRSDSLSPPVITYGSTERDPLMLPTGKQPPYNPAYSGSISKSDNHELCVADQPPSQLCHTGHQEPCTYVPTVNIGLLLALSIHALLEGLVVGLEEAPSKVLLLLAAIATHKLVVGFCLGVELSSNEQITACKFFIMIFIFAAGSVAGIVVGMVITNMPAKITTLAIPVLQGLAGGTLLYVTLSEILPRERARWHHSPRKAGGILQFLAFGIGFAVMTTVTKYLDYE